MQVCATRRVHFSRISVDTHVDILKGRFFAAPTQRLGSLGFLPLDAEDDIAASAQLEGGVVVPWLQDRLRELPTASEARWRRPKHKQTREDARRQWFEK